MNYLAYQREDDFVMQPQRTTKKLQGIIEISLLYNGYMMEFKAVPFSGLYTHDGKHDGRVFVNTTWTLVVLRETLIDSGFSCRLWHSSKFKKIVQTINQTLTEMVTMHGPLMFTTRSPS